MGRKGSQPEQHSLFDDNQKRLTLPAYLEIGYLHTAPPTVATTKSVRPKRQTKQVISKVLLCNGGQLYSF